MKEYDVVIIGAGTAGLTARSQVSKTTDNYIIVDDGPLGTTCARVGCMPSKVLIQVANDLKATEKFASVGIDGAKNLKVDQKKVMAHVRSLRDRFVNGVLSSVDSYEDKLVRKRANILGPNEIDLEGETVKTKKIIIGTGSRPFIPNEWASFKDYIIDTNSFFELEELPEKIAVIGLGVIGIELGQALKRIGVDVVAITRSKSIGGLTDPELIDYTFKKFDEELGILSGGAKLLEITDDNKVLIEAEGKKFKVDKVLASIGRRPNIDNIGIENLGVSLNDKGMPSVDSNTMELLEAKHVYLPGDVNGDLAILHEAADEGRIAGFNASSNFTQCFKRRTPLGITFSDPNIAFVGKRHRELIEEKVDFVIGDVSFEGQGRSIVKLKEIGLLHVYAASESGEILGAEIFGPDGEHLAHLLAWAISMNLNVFEAIKLPFYHPVIEEGLRTALRNAAFKVDKIQAKNELFRCEDAPIR